MVIYNQLLRYQFHISITVPWGGFFGNFTYVKNLRSLDATLKT